MVLFLFFIIKVSYSDVQKKRHTQKKMEAKHESALSWMKWNGKKGSVSSWK